MTGCKADLGLADMDISEAVAAGAKTLLVGVANQGGRIPPHWNEIFKIALGAGLDIASGLHAKLADLPGLADCARENDQKLIEARHSNQQLDVGRGRRRTGNRILPVGTDVSSGKMYTSLTLVREMQQRGYRVNFKATGQTGIFIAGGGIAVDAVVSDFISGSVEWLSPDLDEDQWDVIEGQGSLYHAAFAGVSLGLLHGAQPDYLIVCHDPSRVHMRGTPTIPMPSISDVININLENGRLTNPDIRCIGLAVNTSALNESETDALILALTEEHGLPCIDPVKQGTAVLVDELDRLQSEH
jgi:uncharacterized NAD-dependent epimerase/dehydratase family protein